MFVLIQNGAVIKPYDTAAQFLRDHPDVELADDTTLADLEEFGVLEVAEVPPPAIGEGQTLDLDTPLLVDGIPQQNWIVHDWLEMTGDGLYARVVDGAVVAWPYTTAMLRADFPKSWPVTDPIMLMDGEHDVVAVAPIEPPAVTAGQIAELASPVLVNGEWTQAWTVRDQTAQELAALVPQVVSMRQARLALLAAGSLAAVDAAIAALPSPQKEAAQIEWEYATEVQRDSALIASLAPALGMDDAAIDALFVAAAAIA
ncbi:MAG: hypothetical protein KDE63_12720 [Novosphingobium sp.]|nr:hypothetical protein [Novosphingobium sp.]